MSRYILLFFLCLTQQALMMAQHVNKTDAPVSNLVLDSLYRCLDDAIEHSSDFLRAKQERIDDALARSRNVNMLNRFNAWHDMFEEYRSLNNDSALACIDRCIELAGELKRDDLLNTCLMRKTHQYAEAGAYGEALYTISKVQKRQLSGDQHEMYYNVMHHLYGEMAAYSHDNDYKYHCFHIADQYRDSLLAIADTSSMVYIRQRQIMLNNSHDYAKAKEYSDRWLQLTRADTPDYAEMAFFRSETYKGQNDSIQQKYWLCLSALSDLRSGITNQASLWNLAQLLDMEGDLDRSYAYVDYSWRCAKEFNANLRSWQVSNVMTAINDQYKNHIQRANSQLRWLTGGIGLLALILLGMFIYVNRKKRQLTMTRNELAEANDELASLNTQLKENNGKLNDTNAQLSEANGQLQEMNGRLREAIVHLNDSNLVKEEYIGRFLSICSEYIDKLDAYRLKVNRKLKAQQYNDVLRMTSSDQLREDELDELYQNFDTLFLRLFPTFIDEFYALLRPKDRISLGEKRGLNTDLRIFALIRLGISESSKIAEFLRYSPNSIYAYRARIKNKAIGNRDEFEQRVKEIGIAIKKE